MNFGYGAIFTVSAIENAALASKRTRGKHRSEYAELVLSVIPADFG